MEFKAVLFETGPGMQGQKKELAFSAFSKVFIKKMEQGNFQVTEMKCTFEGWIGQDEHHKSYNLLWNGQQRSLTFIEKFDDEADIDASIQLPPELEDEFKKALEAMHWRFKG